jgi:uncharacterized lipoprotein
MLKPLILSVPALLLISCADTSERYRDTRQLELPPVLPVEHTHVQPALSADDMKPKIVKSPLEKLMTFSDDGGKPMLTLKTRTDRAWEMVVVALKVANIEVIDKSREDNRILVRYDPDTGGREERLLDVFFNNDYPEAEYNVTLKDEGDGIAVNATLNKPDQFEPAEDGSDKLIRLLHKTIDEKIIHRDSKPVESD